MSTADAVVDSQLSTRTAVVVFLAFASAYFFSAVLRAVTGTLAPTLTKEFSLSSGELGLLAGGYFLGFAAMQLPLGRWLDRFGPKRVVLGFLCVAVIGSAAFALADGFAFLLLARVLCGVGVCACLMAPLTAYRRWFNPQTQLRANSWMLMAGSLGMVASTLPVTHLMPSLGWRGIFWLIAGLVLLCTLAIAWLVPRWVVNVASPSASQPSVGYREIFAHPYFRKMAAIGCFNYGGMIAVQSLWAGPWMVRIAGLSAQEAAEGLFRINVAMLVSFLVWGWVNPKLTARGWDADYLIARGLPLSLAALALAIALGPQAHWWAWAAFCVLSTFTSLTQPAVGMAFAPHVAGRALSAFNLLIFTGVFVVQWGIGLVIDALLAAGWGLLAAFQGAFGLYLLACVWAYLSFLRPRAGLGSPSQAR